MVYLYNSKSVSTALDFKLIGTTVFEIVTLTLTKMNLINQEKSKINTHLFKTAIYIAKMV